MPASSLPVLVSVHSVALSGSCGSLLGTIGQCSRMCLMLASIEGTVLLLFAPGHRYYRSPQVLKMQQRLFPAVVPRVHVLSEIPILAAQQLQLCYKAFVMTLLPWSKLRW